MKIVVFDDNHSDRKALLGVLEAWAQKKDYKDLIVFQYDQISKLEFSLPDLLLSDAFFLDIMTPDTANAGFLLAEKIHIENPAANIIFTTNSTEYWSNAFEIFALHYLTKPISPEKIEKLLDYIYHSPSKKSPSTTVLPGIRQEKVFECDQILYIEAKTDKHLAIVHQTNGSLSEINLSSVSFSDLLNSLSSDFVQCHRSFIVNLNYISHYDNHAIGIKGCDQEIRIGESYRSILLSRIIEHQKGLRLR